MFFSSDTVAKLLIAEAFAEDEGDYTCTATNGVGSVTCAAELTVQGITSLIFLAL